MRGLGVEVQVRGEDTCKSAVAERGLVLSRNCKKNQYAHRVQHRKERGNVA